ncbi:hypothetical protein D030_4069B, partial [Vibrio parahaemolyticus AQ3810]
RRRESNGERNPAQQRIR